MSIVGPPVVAWPASTWAHAHPQTGPQPHPPPALPQCLTTIPLPASNTLRPSTIGLTLPLFLAFATLCQTRAAQVDLLSRDPGTHTTHYTLHTLDTPLHASLDSLDSSRPFSFVVAVCTHAAATMTASAALWENTSHHLRLYALHCASPPASCFSSSLFSPLLTPVLLSSVATRKS